MRPSPSGPSTTRPSDDPFATLTEADLRRRTSAKWRCFPADVLPLWVAEMDVPLAEPVVAALESAIRIGDTGYPWGDDYADAYADFALERWGWRPAVEHVRLVPDVMTGVSEVLALVTAPGDPVIITPPVYAPFFGHVARLGRTIREVPLTGTDRLDLPGLERVFAECSAAGTGAAMLLCSPHNPTGTVHTASELTALAELAGRHGVRIVVDEIHAPLTLPGTRFHPFLSVAGGEAGIVVFSAAKGWNLSGLKAAVAVAGPAAAADLARLPELVGHGVSHLAVIAHVAALRHGGGWLDAVREGLQTNRSLFTELLAERLPAVRWRPGAATYLAWLDFRALDLGDDPAEFWLEHARVALNSGPHFGDQGVGFARLNLATGPAILTEAVERMAASLP